MESHLMTEAEKKVISAWQYEGAYALYNMPSYEEQKKKQIALCRPGREKNFFSYCDEGTLVGFTNILEEETEVFMGIGINPALCGRGYGTKVLLAAVDTAGSLYPGKPLYLEVRTWNTRAIRCYEKAGFRVEGAAIAQATLSGEGEFYRMVKVI